MIRPLPLVDNQLSPHELRTLHFAVEQAFGSESLEALSIRMALLLAEAPSPAVRADAIAAAALRARLDLQALPECPPRALQPPPKPTLVSVTHKTRHTRECHGKRPEKTGTQCPVPTTTSPPKLRPSPLFRVPPATLRLANQTSGHAGQLINRSLGWSFQNDVVRSYITELDLAAFRRAYDSPDAIAELEARLHSVQEALERLQLRADHDDEFQLVRRLKQLDPARLARLKAACVPINLRRQVAQLHASATQRKAETLLARLNSLQGLVERSMRTPQDAARRVEVITTALPLLRSQMKKFKYAEKRKRQRATQSTQNKLNTKATSHSPKSKQGRGVNLKCSDSSGARKDPLPDLLPPTSPAPSPAASPIAAKEKVPSALCTHTLLEIVRATGGEGVSFARLESAYEERTGRGLGADAVAAGLRGLDLVLGASRLSGLDYCIGSDRVLLG